MSAPMPDATAPSPHAQPAVSLHRCPVKGCRTILVEDPCERQASEAAPSPDLAEADRLVSAVHDAIYAEPFDQKAASDAVWRVHDVLRAAPSLLQERDRLALDRHEEPATEAGQQLLADFRDEEGDWLAPWQVRGMILAIEREAQFARPDARPIHVIDEEHRRIERESRSPAPLDVERLARAMAVNGISDGDGLPLFDVVERIVVEYACPAVDPEEPS